MRRALSRWKQEALWFKPALASVASIALSVFALWFGQRDLEPLTDHIDEETLVNLFSIFATSSLTVATFTVSGIVAAASAAASSTTPRATGFILNDSRAQFVLSAFIAAFIYSIIGIISLKIFAYGPNGRLLLFGGLIVIVVLVLVAFIDWVGRALRLGRMDTTLSQLSAAVSASLTPENVLALGGVVWDGEAPGDAFAVAPRRFGYVVDIDMAELQRIAERHEARVIVTRRPGDLADRTRAAVLLHPTPPGLDDEDAEALAGQLSACVVVDDRRHSDIDVRFNLISLAETLDRSLSPAINDPGTAIAILAVQLDALSKWVAVRAEADELEPRFDRVVVEPIEAIDLLRDCFTPAVRGGSSIVEIGIRLHKVLGSLSRLGNEELAQAARAISETALELADESLVIDADRRWLRETADAAFTPDASIVR